MNLRSLLAGSAPRVAPLLLGMRFENVADGTSVLISEVEAYTEDDPASHSFRGETARNRSMFAPAGTLYVYRSYGVHWCANIVTGPPELGEAVLLRGGIPEANVELMMERRGRRAHLTDGPGKLCSALGITGDHDGSSLFDGPYRLSPGSSVEWETRTRVGLSVATENLWRFRVRGFPDSESGQVPSCNDET